MQKLKLLPRESVMTFIYGSLACVLLAASATYAETTFSFTNQWSGGGQGLFHITNDTSQPIQGWTLRFDWNAEITSAWNGTVQSHVGNQYKIVNAEYNATIAPGASVDVGCVANFASAGLLPTSITIAPLVQCPSDLNVDSRVDAVDLAVILSNWGSTSALCDLNGDGVTDSADLACCAARSGNARPAVDSPVHPCARHAARPARLIFNAVDMVS